VLEVEGGDGGRKVAAKEELRATTEGCEGWTKVA